VRATTTGRPRLTARKRPGDTARDEVLDAAAELFTTLGVAATSTRQIAEAVGIRQASLYHHFRTKDDILAALLSGTVVSSLAAAERLLPRPEPAAVRLHALVHLDARLLWDSPYNLGILYLLPEVRDEKFAEFHDQRMQLRRAYRTLSQQVIAEAGAASGPDGYTPDEDVAFRLVETLPNLRTDGLGAPDQPQRTADLAIYALGWRGDWPALRTAAGALADRIGTEISTG